MYGVSPILRIVIGDRMTYSQFRTLMVGIMGNLDSAQMKVQVSDSHWRKRGGEMITL